MCACACMHTCLCTCWWHLVNHEHCVPTENSGCWLLLQEHAECLCSQFMRGISVSHIAVESLDLITIVVPPALPAAMTVGRFYAQNRLRAKNVYCISPRTINVSGSIDCVCFDKVCHFSETILILNLSWILVSFNCLWISGGCLFVNLVPTGNCPKTWATTTNMALVVVFDLKGVTCVHLK